MQLKNRLQKMSMKIFKISFIFILSVSKTFALTPEQIMVAKKKATLLITVRDKNLKYREVGAGFFTDNKGHFVTNFHVLENYINNPKDYLVQFQNSTGDEFTDVEIDRCRNENNIDLCYGKIATDKKVYFLDVNSRSPMKSQSISLIGHSNQEFFLDKKGEVQAIEFNVEEKYGIPFAERENRNTSMIEIGKYVCKNGSCKGDSGGPVFDSYSGDLVGVFCNTIGKKNQDKKIYAIDTKDVYSFINSDTKFVKFKIPPAHFHTMDRKSEATPKKGDEFEAELKSGKLD